MTSTTALGARIRQARRAAGMSQSQMANRIGAHFTSVSDWERGKNEPSARHLISIARETGQPLAFFGEDDDEEAASMYQQLERAVRAVARQEVKRLLREGHAG